MYEGDVNVVSLTKFKLHNTTLSETKQYHFHKLLPLTVNTQEYGIKITPNFSKGLITHFTMPNSKGGRDIFEGFGENYQYQYVVVNNNVSIKYIYDSSAIIINIIKDVIIDNSNFTRVIGNISLVIKDNKPYEYIINTPLNAIKKPNDKVVIETSNPWLGTLDLDTYLSPDGFNRVYAAGFKTSEGLYTYYINRDTMNSDDVVIECINNMLQPRYNKYVFYAHNFSGYDAAFILKILTDYNGKRGSNIYNMKTIFRDNRIISLTISKKYYVNDLDTKGKIIKIRLLDSILMLDGSLFGNFKLLLKLNSSLKVYFYLNY